MEFLSNFKNEHLASFKKVVEEFSELKLEIRREAYDINKVWMRGYSSLWGKTVVDGKYFDLKNFWDRYDEIYYPSTEIPDLSRDLINNLLQNALDELMDRYSRDCCNDLELGFCLLFGISQEELNQIRAKYAVDHLADEDQPAVLNMNFQLVSYLKNFIK